MPIFDKDLFISYAHIDNQPLTPAQEGWISRFHVSLNALLSMRLGKRARIWRDDKLQGNDVFADEIVEQFGRTAVLLSVLSPRYLKSEWCTREVTEFCKRARESGGMLVSNKARVFKVLKTPVESEEPLPELVKSLLGYEFFTMEDGTPLELDAVYGERYAQDFNRKVNKLAYEISQLLAALEAGAELGRFDREDDATGPTDAVRALVENAIDAAQPSTGDADVVSGAPSTFPDTLPSAPVPASASADTDRCLYLAECSFDRKEEREILQTELMRLGYTVLPDRNLPRDEAEYIAAVRALLARCTLSVHLVGAHAGAVADGPSGKSLTVVQNELAVERSRDEGLRRLIWLPDGTRSEEPRQQAFIDALHEDADVQFGADLITAGLESLKRSMFAALEKEDVGQSVQLPPPNEDGWTMIHLLCTHEDRKDTVPLRRFLKSRGIDVTLPAFEGNAAEVRAVNQLLLSRCDAVLLYYGRGDEAWKRTADTELRKLPFLRKGTGLPPIHTYLASPPTSDKEDLVDLEEGNLVDALDGFAEERMTAVLESVGVVPEATP